MKSISLLFALIVLVTLSSCSRYQYAYMKSNLGRNEKQEFIQENDSFAVKYSFEGRNCPVSIEVFNKQSVPLYVDWKKSAVIIDSNRLSLWEDRASLNGSTSESAIQWNKYYSTSSGSMEAIIYRNEQISFIPPMSFVRVSPIGLRNKFFNFSIHDSVSTVNFYEASGHTRAKRYIYDNRNSPLVFRCYMALSIKEDFSEAIYTDNTFWVNDVVQSYSKLPINKPDNFYLKKPTGVGIFLGVATTVAIIAIPISLFANAMPDVP